MKRLLIRCTVTIVALLAIAAVLVWRILAGSLPTLAGEMEVATLEASLTIERDATGIPTLRAANREDLAFATGFVHAQDRYFQMDLLRRKAAGELAALVGPAALPLDRRHRLHRFRWRARRALAALDAADKALLRAYARGANAARAGTDSRPFEYVVLRTRPAPWLPEDSLLVLYAMFIELNDERADGDLQRGYAERVLPSAVFAFMYPDGTPWDAPLIGEARTARPIPGPEVYDLRAVTPAPAVGVLHDDAALAPGSNSWVVAGSLTASGRALVASDMHLGLTVPNIFYRARLQTTGVDVSGVMLPGVPPVIAGSNGRIAWAFTNSYGDSSDAVVLRPGVAPATYRSGDSEQCIVEVVERIQVRGAADEELRVRETHWGPIRDDVKFAGAEVAVRWTAHNTEAVNLSLIELETAPHRDAALSIATRSGIPPQNFLVGDAEGKIGWTIAGRLPTRGAFDSRLPVDWSVTDGWTGWLAPADYPRIVDPEDGRLWTANARVVDGAALRRLGDSGYAHGARARQIRDALRARERFLPHDMLRIQLDDRALFLQRWRDLLLTVLDDAALGGRADRARYRDLVEDWVPRALPSSVGYRLVHAFHEELRSSAFEMLMTPVRTAYPEPVPLRISRQFDAPLWSLVTERPMHLLSAEYRNWRDFMLAAVDRILVRYASLDGELAARSWGERNIAAIRHPLSASLPFAARWLDMPRNPLPGDRYLPRVQAPAFGAAERFAVAPGAERDGYMHLPGGQSGHPLSPFYRRGHSAWEAGLPAAFLPAAPLHVLRLSPPE